MVAETKFDFKEYIAARRQLVESRLDGYLGIAEPAVLWESMRYSVLAGGKRMRALLCLASAEAVSPSATEAAVPCACAIEMVHAMSLIHDDLPALDNDDLRRGRPTNHKVYGEAMALLAGDALLMLATEVLVNETPVSVARDVLLSVVSELSRATGADGMVGGQVIDMRLTGLGNHAQSPADGATLESMHRRKTGALIRFSTWSGARLAGAETGRLEQFKRFGEILGLAFQITDDLLDITGDAATLGKTPGKDQASAKVTWVQLFGEAESRAKLAALEEEGKELLGKTGMRRQAVAPLESLLDYAIRRVN